MEKRVKKTLGVKKTYCGLLIGAAVLFAGTGVFASSLNGDGSYTEGPQVCGACHDDAFTEWLSNGHSRKLSPGPVFGNFDGMWGLTANARDMGIPLPDHDSDVYNWDNILMVIGNGKNWKSRFVGMDGYVITKNGENQYNWADGSWGDYHTDEVKPFSCGPCHTTGYNPDGDVFADFAEGFVGDWAHFNITCESCHGPGADHAGSADPADIVKIADTNSDNEVEINHRGAKHCDECHARDHQREDIIVSGGYIKHRQQSQELWASPHKSVTDCIDCHNPHQTRRMGIKVQEGANEICAKCHIDQLEEYEGSLMHQADVMCQDCHMAPAAKSATPRGKYEGDVLTHIFRINSDADYSMFVGGDRETAELAKDALSLEFACFRCHADADKSEYADFGDDGTAYHTIGK